MRLTGFAFEVLQNEEVSLIHQGALRILAEMGMEVQNKQLLGILQAFGLQVDFQLQRVHFPTTFVERFIAEADKTDWAQVKPTVEAGQASILANSMIQKR